VEFVQLNLRINLGLMSGLELSWIGDLTSDVVVMTPKFIFRTEPWGFGRNPAV